jgi:hypothetical protein
MGRIYLGERFINMEIISQPLTVQGSIPKSRL